MKNKLFKKLTLKEIEEIISNMDMTNEHLDPYDNLSPRMKELVNSEILKELERWQKRKQTIDLQ
jgi:hypothetical protein|uniref:Uncharacterized protein n=1 Tax=Myoviridae sp. ctPuP5 TaxID=2823543 RepID=A0A8S5LA60_9CAUD|nr:MAG TPA: hypothetical protein [Myoviridae sp. ctPuP5]